MTERQIHDGFVKWLRFQRLSYVHHRMDRKSGIAEGWPDFTIVHCGRALPIEVKTLRGRLSEKQKSVIRALTDNGTVTHVCRSVEECVRTTQEWLGVINTVNGERALSHEAPVSGNDVSDGKGDRYKKHDWAKLKREIAKVDAIGVDSSSGVGKTDPLSVPVNGTEVSPGDSRKLFIGNFRGEDWVFRRIHEGSNDAMMIHKADSHDLQTLPRVLD
jgi:hypothetical protein